MTTMWVYAVGPIDFWRGWQSLRQLLVDVWTAPDEGQGYFHPYNTDELLRWWSQAQELARLVGWEGDIRGGFGSESGPWVAPLPWETGEYRFVMAWKQDNNGETFISTPVLLPWLHDHASHVINEKRAIFKFVRNGEMLRTVAHV